MAEALTVLMASRVAATLTRSANNLLRLAYDPSYPADANATPISLSMPTTMREHVDTPARRVVSNFLWGLLPDNDAVLERWARHYQVRSTSPFFLLGTPVGEDCAGAVAFCPPDRVASHVAREGAVE
jgi:serine/threonine-protein kinase HipA